MFKNRKLTVRVEKADKKPVDEASETKFFEEKAAFMLHKFESFAAKAFVGICIYVILDTKRQIAIEQAKCHHE
jgi:hypothetical protein